MQRSSSKEDSEESSDEIERIKRTNVRNKKRKAKPKKERDILSLQRVSSYGYEYTVIFYGSLKGGFHKGAWGGQPYLHGGIDYDTIVKRIEDSGIEEWKIAEAILAKIDDEKSTYLEELTSGNKALLDALKDLLFLTQVIESHDTRAPGWDKVARGLLSTILNRGATFRACFNRKNGAFLPAWRKKAGAPCGGQEAVRAFMSLVRKKSDNVGIDYKSIKKIIDFELIKALDEEMSESSDEEDDPDVLHQSVLTEAKRIGVDEHYEIGYADGTDHNCSIISVFAAAGVKLTREQAKKLREHLAKNNGAPSYGDIDLDEDDIAQAILDLVTEQTGKGYTLYALQEGDEDYEITKLARTGDGAISLFVFFAGRHFSPAWHL